MMSSTWLWVTFLAVFLLFPMGFGWGYRGWGPPYPRYVQRRRFAQASAAGGIGTFDHHAWGRAGDLIWVGLIVATLWAFTFMWWR